MDCKCTQDKRLESMETDIKEIQNTISGKNGLLSEIAVMNSNSTMVSDALTRLNQSVEKLNNKKLLQEGADIEKDKMLKSNRFLLTTLIAIVSLVSGYIIKLIFG